LKKKPPATKTSARTERKQELENSATRKREEESRAEQSAL
jgi:hypothetical protein